MKPFTTVALPHRDVLEGKLTMEVFAANLWEVFKGRAPDEYKDPEIFFRKTELTQGLRNLIAVVEKRLNGKGGDPVIQLQTPFGGGKTHALIALYHKAKEWKCKVVVIDGEAFDPKEIAIWEEMEKQLTGKIKNLGGKTSPGREKLRALLSSHQPILILIDEILQYTTKAAGVKVGSSNLASQVLAFIQELTDAVSILDRSALVFSLPSSLLEHYDENAEKLFHQLQKIAGRTEKIYAPVQDEEVPSIVRRRLFSSIDEKEAKEIVEEFVDFAEREKILPEGVEKSAYRENFLKSFPFQPEVIDILYKRWGSYVTFQRTRGVLRLLALVIHSLKDSKNPYIKLADFDLRNMEIRRELLKHIGPQFDSVINQDITSSDSAARKVDKVLGDAYLPFSFGYKVATAIFMYSFAAGPEAGATISEIKRSSADPSVTSSIIADAVDQLSEKAFYLWKERGKYFFTVQPNLNKVLLTKMEGIKDDELKTEEKNLLASHLKKEHFSIYIWPHASKDVPDTTELKLVILQNHNRCKEFLETCGEKPRVHRNTMIFLCSVESERGSFEDSLRKKLAWQRIKEDATLKLTPEQIKESREKAEDAESTVVERVRELYRMILVPSKREFKEISLGRPTFGVEINFDREVYERLKDEGEIVERLSPLSLREKYLKTEKYVETRSILNSFLNTPGEVRITSVDVLKNCIREGVKQGLFGLGYLTDKKPVLQYFQEDSAPELVEKEIIVSAKLCKPKGISEKEFEKILKEIRECPTIGSLDEIRTKVEDRLSLDQRKKLSEEIEKIREELKVKPKAGMYKIIELGLEVPSGRMSDVARITSYLRGKFNQVSVKMELSAKDGEITTSEYEDKIMEALRQAGVRIERESKK